MTEQSTILINDSDLPTSIELKNDNGILHKTITVSPISQIADPVHIVANSGELDFLSHVIFIKIFSNWDDNRILSTNLHELCHFYSMGQYEYNSDNGNNIHYSVTSLYDYYNATLSLMLPTNR